MKRSCQSSLLSSILVLTLRKLFDGRIWFNSNMDEEIKEEIAGILCDKSKYDKSSCILYDLSGIKMILNL